MGNIFNPLEFGIKKYDLPVVKGEWIELRFDLKKNQRLELSAKTDGDKFHLYFNETIEFLFKEGVTDWSFNFDDGKKIPIDYEEGFLKIPVSIQTYLSLLLLKHFLGIDWAGMIDIVNLPNISLSTSERLERRKLDKESKKKVENTKTKLENKGKENSEKK